MARRNDCIRLSLTELSLIFDVFIWRDEQNIFDGLVKFTVCLICSSFKFVRLPFSSPFSAYPLPLWFVSQFVQDSVVIKNHSIYSCKFWNCFSMFSVFWRESTSFVQKNWILSKL